MKKNRLTAFIITVEIIELKRIPLAEINEKYFDPDSLNSSKLRERKNVDSHNIAVTGLESREFPFREK